MLKAPKRADDDGNSIDNTNSQEEHTDDEGALRRDITLHEPLMLHSTAPSIQPFTSAMKASADSEVLKLQANTFESKSRGRRPRASRTQHIQPLLWRVDLNTLPESLRYVYALHLPDTWIDGIIGLQRGRSGDSEKSAPFLQLEAALHSRAPEIICFMRGVFKHDAQKRSYYWLLADGSSLRRPDLEQVFVGISEWLRLAYGDAGGKLIASRIRANEMEWHYLDLWEQYSRDPQIVNAVLPDLIARHLVREQAELWLQSKDGPVYGGPLLRAPSNDKRAELITLPPNSLQRGLKQHRFSYLLDLRTVSVPGSEEIYLRTHVGVRRWVGRPLIDEQGQVWMDPGNKTVSLMRKGASWLTKEKAPGERSLVTLRLSRHGAGEVEWQGGLPKLLSALDWKESVPDASDFLRNPEHYQPNLLMTWDTRMREKHAVGPGVEARDRWEVFEQLDKVMPSGITAVEAWDRLPERRSTLTNHATRDFSKVPVSVRMQGLRRMAGEQPAIIEICAEDPQPIVDAFRELLPELVEGDPFIGEYCRCEHLRVVQSPLDPEHWQLLPDHVTRGPLETLRRTEQVRAEQIASALPVTGAVYGTLIEMPNYQETLKYSERRRDPKRAVRWGMARGRRASQFLQPLEKAATTLPAVDIEKVQQKNAGRIKNAVRDLLRQLDYSLGDLYCGGRRTALPEQLDLLGMWVVRMNRKPGSYRVRGLPLIIWSRQGEQQKYVCIPGPNGPEWLSMRSAMLALPDLADDDSTGMDDWQCRAWFEHALRDIGSERNALLLVSKANLGEVWPELTDVVLTKGEFTLGGTLGAVMLQHPRLRVARIRSSGEFEVPDVCPVPGGLTEEEYRMSFGQFKALYKHENHPKVFYSIQSRPPTQQRANGLTQADVPSKPSWNPATVEIVMANLQERDVPEEWAWLVHRLREESPHYDEATYLPEPLYSLSKLREYVLQVREIDEETIQPIGT